MGFQLPPLLKRIYREIGNGGRKLGPAYGIHGVGSGYESPNDNLLELTSRIAREHGWWEEFIVIAEIGCGSFYCVDCGDSDYPVYLLNGGQIASWMYDDDYDPDEVPDSGWDVEYDTLEEWLTAESNFEDT